MYSFFPDLRLCELDWKVNRLATETYSSWFRKRKGKLAVSVKQEDASAKDAENLRRVNGGISLSATTQPPKRPGPPSPPPVDHAKKVKSSSYSTLSSSVSSRAQATPAPFLSPLSLPTNSVVPTCSTLAHIHPFDSDSPGSRPTTPLPQATSPYANAPTATSTLSSPLPVVGLDGPGNMVGMEMGGEITATEMTASDSESSKAPVSLVAISQYTY